MRKRTAVACVVLLAIIPTIAAGQGGDLDDRVNDAIAKGLEYLRREQSRAGHWDYRHMHEHRLGMTALAGLALLENRVPADDPAIERARAVVRELALESDQSYDLSLAILFLSRVQGTSRGELDDLIARLARRLEGGNAEGVWSYRVPLEAEETGTASAYARRPRGFLSGPGDHSNTQFALLGMWAGGRHGFDSDAALGSLDGHFRSAVNRDGGWGYRPGMGSTPSMTCAGLMALSIAAARPSQAERLSARARGQALAADPVFRQALEAVGKQARSIGRQSDVYYLWSLERVCVALGLRDLDGFDWYEAGAEALLDRQLATGGWPNGQWGSLPETCLALLFLRKANLAFELDRVLKLPGPAMVAGGPGPVDDGPGGEAAPEAGEAGVIVRQVDESGFPEIALDFEIRGPDGSPVLDASEADIRVAEYEQPVEILRFEAPTSREAVQTTVVLVVDHSRSMEAEDRIGALKEAVRTFLGVMPEGSRVAVVAFSDEIRVICPFSTDVKRVQEAVDALQPTGGTRYYDAVVEALELISGESGRRAVLAMTDGEDTFSQSADLESAILAARRVGLPVHTLGLGTEDEIASDDLRRLAAGSRGQYFPARDAAQLLAIYEEIATRLGQMYRLVYRTDRDLPDGTLRPVSVSYRASAAVGRAEVFIRGMVVPASGWPRLFLLLVGGLAGLSLLPGLLRRRPAAGGVR